MKKICLICAAVVMAWAVLLILMRIGYPIDKTLVAILMGMSLGAIAATYPFGLIWKSGFVILGLLVVWFLLENQVSAAAMALLGLVLLTIWFRSKIKKKGKQPVDSIDRFKDCC